MRRRLIMILVLTVCLTAFSGGMMVYAKEREQPKQTYYKYYTSIRVEEGDTLWGIADGYLCEESGSRADYIQEVKRLNGLKNDTIQTGQYLTVVYYSTEYK